MEEFSQLIPADTEESCCFDQTEYLIKLIRSFPSKYMSSPDAQVSGFVREYSRLKVTRTLIN